LEESHEKLSGSHGDLLISYNGLKLAHGASITKVISCEPYFDISTTSTQNAILSCSASRLILMLMLHASFKLKCLNHCCFVKTYNLLPHNPLWDSFINAYLHNSIITKCMMHAKYKHKFCILLMHIPTYYIVTSCYHHVL
jgi:hypothetical protein